MQFFLIASIEDAALEGLLTASSSTVYKKLINFITLRKKL